MSNDVNGFASTATNERRTVLTKQAMREILKGIIGATQESSLTGMNSDGYLLYIQTYNSLRKKAIENNWIDPDIVIELDFQNESIFGNEETKPKIEKMDIIGAAVVVFRSSLSGE